MTKITFIAHPLREHYTFDVVKLNADDHPSYGRNSTGYYVVANPRDDRDAVLWFDHSDNIFWDKPHNPLRKKADALAKFDELSRVDMNGWKLTKLAKQLERQAIRDADAKCIVSVTRDAPNPPSRPTVTYEGGTGGSSGSGISAVLVVVGWIILIASIVNGFFLGYILAIIAFVISFKLYEESIESSSVPLPPLTESEELDQIEQAILGGEYDDDVVDNSIVNRIVSKMVKS